jgi:hypothetical protein
MIQYLSNHYAEVIVSATGVFVIGTMTFIFFLIKRFVKNNDERAIELFKKLNNLELILEKHETLLSTNPVMCGKIHETINKEIDKQSGKIEEHEITINDHDKRIFILEHKNQK